MSSRACSTSHPEHDGRHARGLSDPHVPPSGVSRASDVAKRAMDIVVATIGIVITSPLFAYIAWRVHRDSQGPILFRQTRLGLDKRPFTALKFRTMRVDVTRCAPEVHRRRHGLARCAERQWPLQAGAARRRDAARAAGCAARASTSCRSCSTCCAARCRSSALARAFPTRPTISAAPLRALRRAAGNHGLLAGHRPRPLDVRRGARHGCRVRPRTLVRTRPSTASAHTGAASRARYDPMIFVADSRHVRCRLVKELNDGALGE